MPGLFRYLSTVGFIECTTYSWPVVTNDPAASMVCPSVTRLHCAKTAERMEVLFGEPKHTVKPKLVKLRDT